MESWTTCSACKKDDEQKDSAILQGAVWYFQFLLQDRPMILELGIQTLVWMMEFMTCDEEWKKKVKTTWEKLLYKRSQPWNLAFYTNSRCRMMDAMRR